MGAIGEHNGSNGLPLGRNKTPEQVTAEFKALFDELGQSPAEVAERMNKLGDYRSYDAALRSIQRMLSGETRVSGEMNALMTMMVRQQRRLIMKLANLSWSPIAYGQYFAEVDEFGITLIPQTRGRWKVEVRHNGGYSHPWPRWQDNLEVAKRKALLSIEDATDFLIEQDFIEESIKRNGMSVKSC